MMSVLQAHVALIGGSCALLALLIGTMAVEEIRSSDERRERPRPKHIGKTALIGSLFFMLAAMLVAFGGLIVDWAR